jgi:hypothetical protein
MERNADYSQAEACRGFVWQECDGGAHSCAAIGPGKGRIGNGAGSPIGAAELDGSRGSIVQGRKRNRTGPGRKRAFGWRALAALAAAAEKSALAPLAVGKRYVIEGA